jgi:plasmid stabilization system protein ParE
VLFRSNPSAALRLNQLFNDEIDSLKESPNRYPLWEVEGVTLKREYRKLMVDSRYLVIYTIEENDDLVIIHYIFDSKSDVTNKVKRIEDPEE